MTEQDTTVEGRGLKVAVSASAPGPDGEVDARFGRAPYFVIADLAASEYQVVVNKNLTAAGGAGAATAQMLVSKGVQVVLTGDCGPNALDVLDAAGVKVITGVSGSVGAAIKAYREGALEARATAPRHRGFGRGRWRRL